MLWKYRNRIPMWSDDVTTTSERGVVLAVAVLIMVLCHRAVQVHGRHRHLNDNKSRLDYSGDPNFNQKEDAALWMTEAAYKPGSATSGKWFLDRHGRRLILRGVNLSGSCKSPMEPFLPSYAGGNKEFFNDLDVCFVGRPFPLEEADEHLSLIKSWGFNVLRLLITWEAIEHFGPGIYDDDYVDYLIALIRKATKEYGLRVFLDPHQDVWSRHCGGSGAPNWTLRLVGLDARAFYNNGAAICHSSWTAANPDKRPEDYPNMLWPTNYYKLACATMFTLFFGGKTFAPRFVVSQARTAGRPDSNHTFNVQDYLTFHFVQAMGYVAKKVADAGLYYSSNGDGEGGVLGWDTFNEPSQGWIGCPDITTILPWQELRHGATPSPYEALRAGIGETMSVNNYRIAWYGPKKSGKVVINQNKVSAWRRRMTPQELFDEGMKAAHAHVTVDHTRMEAEGFKPSDSQPPMKHDCVWASHGVYDPENIAPKINNYFALNSLGGSQTVTETFTEHFWMPFVFQLSKKLRTIYKDTIIFLEPPVNEKPPNLIDRSEDNLPTWFPDQLVYTPHWYDGLTLLTKQYSLFNVDYLHFIRGYKSILSAICLGEKSIRRGMRSQLRLIQKESEQLGTVPTLIGEIGVPFNMASKKECAKALDSNFHAIEKTLSHATLWNYCPDNDPKLGDQWNGEDLSLVQNGKLRCPEKTIRPFPIATSGIPLKFHFDSDSGSFEYSFESRLLVCDDCNCSYPWGPPKSNVVLSDSSELPAHATTEIFLPDQHFSNPDQLVIRSSDEWVIDTERQVLRIFIGHQRVLSETTKGPLSGSHCEACMFPTSKQKLIPLWRKHFVELYKDVCREGDSVKSTKNVLYFSWAKENGHMRCLNKLSIFERFLRWVSRTFANMRLYCKRLKTEALLVGE